MVDMYVCVYVYICIYVFISIVMDDKTIPSSEEFIKQCIHKVAQIVLRARIPSTGEVKTVFQSIRIEE